MRQRMKAMVWMILCMIIVCMVALICFGSALFRRSASVPEGLVISVSDVFCSANHAQSQSFVWMGAYQGELYFCPKNPYTMRMTVYDGWLCVFRDGKVEKLMALRDNTHIIGLSDGFIYYWVYRNAQDEDVLYGYDLKHREESVLFVGRAGYRYAASFSPDGALTVPCITDESGKEVRLLRIVRGKLCADSNDKAGYVLGERRYSISNGDYLDDILMVEDASGLVQRIPLAAAQNRALIPCGDQLLIHNEGDQELLYSVNTSGELKLLFQTECLNSCSAVTVVGNNAYLSLLRYEKLGPLALGGVRYEDDQVEGTYRVNLDDFSVRKISNEIYNGLYYFGGDCLYACDQNCNIYRLGLDGNVLETLFQVNI